MYEIGQYLRAALKKNNMKQKDLAAAMDMSQEHISKICLNKVLPSMDALIKMCSILHMSFSDFFSSNENVPSTTTNLEEQAFLIKYRHLPRREQQAIMNLVSNLYEGLNPSSMPTSEPCMRQVSGFAAAGSPLFNDNIDEFVPVPPKYIDSDRYVIIKAKGDSMEPTIRNGDYVVADRNNPDPLQGDIALVSVEGFGEEDEYTIKKFYRYGSEIELDSINPEYQSMTFDIRRVKSVFKIVHIISQYTEK